MEGTFAERTAADIARRAERLRRLAEGVHAEEKQECTFKVGHG
jgi:hypothetical protein